MLSHRSEATLNVRERLLTALAGKEPDRVPITLYGVYPYSVGDRMCLIGNVQIGDVISGERADVDSRVQAAIRDGAPGGGFILSITASPYEEELSAQALENYRQLVRSGRDSFLCVKIAS
jgi:hypothetical protein